MMKTRGEGLRPPGSVEGKFAVMKLNLWRGLKFFRNEKGVSLLAVIFVILVLSAIGYTFTAIMAAKQRAVPPTLDGGRAFYIAEAGTQFAGIYLENLSSWASAASQTRTLGAGSFTVAFSGYTSGGGVESITCTATGTYGSGQRVLVVTFQRSL
jgi:Tfp pilus assembly protein PilX